MQCGRNSPIITYYPGVWNKCLGTYIEGKEGKQECLRFPGDLLKALMKCCCFWYANSEPLTTLQLWFHENAAADGLLSLCLVCGNTWLRISKYFRATVIEQPKVVPHGWWTSHQAETRMIPPALDSYNPQIGFAIIECNQLWRVSSIQGREHSITPTKFNDLPF